MKAIDTFSNDITRNAATSATSNLSKTRDATTSDEERAENFNSVTTAFIYISRQCGLDIQTAEVLLCTRVADSDEDDRAKLKRVLQHLREMIDLELTL